jgi:hypothetical protein
MSGYPTLVEFVFRFFTHWKRTEAAGEQRNVASSDVSADLGGAQPVCRLLDNSEDIAEEYAKFPYRGDAHPGNLTEQREVGRSGSVEARNVGAGAKATENSQRSSEQSLGAGWGSQPVRKELSGAGNLRQKEKQIVATPAPESNLLTFTCDTTNETFCGEFVCEEPALGICKHCNQFVCRRCLKSGYCYVADHREVSLQ